MLVHKAVQLVVLTATVMLCGSTTDAATSTFRLCGRKLGEIMSRVCHVYNSPSWDVPTVVEHPTAVVRRRRQVGIADECCTYGCTWEQLSEYCSISVNSESLIEGLETHMIEDRSAEQHNGGSGATAPIVTGNEPGSTRLKVKRRGQGRGARPREVGGARSGGYGRAPRGRRCWCRRKRRSGRRRASLMGNTDLVKNVARAAPVVGTVSPLLTWGRTLNTDLPHYERDKYAYIAVYS